MENKNEPAAVDPFQLIDDMAGVVEMFTGMKNQFVNAGWEPGNAELMVIEVMRSAGRTQQT